MPQTNIEIAQSIRSLAKEKGVTIKQTLEDCKINRNFIYDLEHGNSSPSVDKISRIAAYFGVSTFKLIGAADGELASFIALYDRLTAKQKSDLLSYMRALLDNPD